MNFIKEVRHLETKLLIIFFGLKSKADVLKYIYHFFKETIRHSRTTRND